MSNQNPEQILVTSYDPSEAALSRYDEEPSSSLARQSWPQEPVSGEPSQASTEPSCGWRRPVWTQTEFNYYKLLQTTNYYKLQITRNYKESLRITTNLLSITKSYYEFTKNS